MLILDQAVDCKHTSAVNDKNQSPLRYTVRICVQKQKHIFNWGGDRRERMIVR